MKTLSRAYLEQNSAIFTLIENLISGPSANANLLILDMVRQQCINNLAAYNIYRKKYGDVWQGNSTLAPEVKKNWYRLFMEELGVDEQTVVRWASNHNQGVGYLALLPVTNVVQRQFEDLNACYIREDNYFSIQGEIYCCESFYFSHMKNVLNDTRHNFHGFVQVIAKSGAANGGYVLESITVHSEDSDHEQFLVDCFLKKPEFVSRKGNVLQPLQNTVLAEFMECYGNYIKLVAQPNGTFKLQVNNDVVNKEVIPLGIYLKLTRPNQQQTLLTELAQHMSDPKNRIIYKIDQTQLPQVCDAELNNQAKEDALLIGSVSYAHLIESLNSAKQSGTRKSLPTKFVVCDMSLPKKNHFIAP